MDRILARRLENDEKFREKIRKIATDYASIGIKALEYYTPEYDVAHDMIHCYRRMSKKDLEILDRGASRRFMLPMTATQIETMTVQITRRLVGEGNPHKVEARTPEDEIKAETMNQLLRYNADQQNMYTMMYCWIKDILAYNRGILYDYVETQTTMRVEQEMVEDPETLIEEVDEVTGEVRQVPEKYPKLVKKQVSTGAILCKLDLISPYDFFFDPSVPTMRMQDGRFAGHKQKKSWIELKSRSLLQVDDPQYVSPRTVDAIKEKKVQSNSMLPTSQQSSSTTNMTSRTGWERNRTLSPLSGGKNADKNDHGTVELMEIWIRLVPSEYELGESDAPTMYRILLGSGEVLSIDDSSYAHDMYPYSVSEGRPSPHYNYVPGWAILIKGIQDHCDYLKDKHQEALARTTGNMFIYKPEYVDWEDFTSPDKIGLGIPLKPEVPDGLPIGSVIQQMPVQDMTRDFYKEMNMFVSVAEQTTSANSAMQGGESSSDTATEATISNQMGGDRLSSVARIISTTALVPQTRRLVSNFQQFLPAAMIQRLNNLEDGETGPQGLQIKLKGDSIDSIDEWSGRDYVMITGDSIQGQFDYVAHDGSLPGTDARAVAAGTRLLEAASNPAFSSAFDPFRPGSIDVVRLVMDIAKKSGFPVRNYRLTASDVQRNIEIKIQQEVQKQLAMQTVAASAPQPPDMGPQGGGLPPQAGNEPDAEVPLPPAELPIENPEPQVRPENIPNL